MTAARIGYWTMTALACLVAIASMRMLSFSYDALGPELIPNAMAHPAMFFTHTTLAPIALLLGAFQFLPRTRRTSWHRWAGRIYVAACLIGAISGFAVAFTTVAGPWGAASLATLAVLWFVTTLLAFLRARARDFAAHRAWMIRSYALTCAAITLRIILALGMATGATFEDAYLVSILACWPANLLLAEVIIRSGTRARAA